MKFISVTAVFATLAAACGMVCGDAPDVPTESQVRNCIQNCIQYLMSSQNKDGSWGSHGFDLGDQFWSNPETHRSWIVATTGLSCTALEQAAGMEAKARAGGIPSAQVDELHAAYDRGLDYVLANALVKRPNDWDVDNVWAYVYGLQFMADAYTNPRLANDARRPKMREVGEALAKLMATYQSASGGWGYYDFEVHAMPNAWATSFTTAVGVLALVSARKAGFELPGKLTETSARAVRRCRLPSGAYTYTVEAIPTPGRSEWIDQIKGSLGRIQVCNLALLKFGDDVSVDVLKRGIAHFFREHRFLDIARKKPIPHEAYYYNSGYFYFFGHYYAAQVISRLPAEERARCWPRLQHEIIKCQEKDGSMWDYYMNTYHKPYGTSFGLMTLCYSLADVGAAGKTEGKPLGAEAPAGVNDGKGAGETAIP